MGGLKSLFTKLIPIVFLICFICLGITHTFATANVNNLTYMSQETYNIGTEENPEQFTYYELDVNGYMNGINNNVLQRAVTNTIDLDNYSRTISRFNEIWADGYQFGDGVQTIVNAIILAINSILTIINIIITPIRVISGLILTALSVVGINITTNGAIITMLNGILDYASIPLINPTFNSDDLIMDGETWEFNSQIYGNLDNYYFTFTSNNQTFTRIRVEYVAQQSKYIMQYYDENNSIVTAFDGTWQTNTYKTIVIVEMPETDGERATIYRFLNNNATQIS